LVTSVDPAGAPATLASPSRASFSTDFVGYVRTARREVDAFDQMLVQPSEAPTRLRERIAVAEAARSVGKERVGRAWLDAVTSFTRAEFQRVAPLPDQVFTLTSTTGTILLRMGDPGPEPRRVAVELQSSWFRFPEGSSRSATLRSSSQPIPFTVQATATGRRTIRVLVRSGPTGLVIAERNIVVGSTAANRVALFIAGAAAIALVVLWARRLFPRTTT
jgi:hypothetical protein